MRRVRLPEHGLLRDQRHRHDRQLQLERPRDGAVPDGLHPDPGLLEDALDLRARPAIGSDLGSAAQRCRYDLLPQRPDLVPGVLDYSEGRNAYYILAHQYEAAKLNILSGAASTTDVNAAIAWAETFFNTYTPSDHLSKTERQQAIYYAGILGQYNEGLIGPGHCSEDWVSIGAPA